MIVLFFIFLILMIVAFLISKFGEEGIKKGFKIGGFCCLAVSILFFILSTFYVIDPGETGIEVLFGKVVDKAENGIHGKNPFASVTTLDLRTQKEDFENVQGTSQDLQLVIVDCTVQYRIDYMHLEELYTKVGTNYFHKVVVPGIKDAVKTSCSTFKVEDIVVNRTALKEKIEESLKEKMSKFYLELQDYQITDVDFSKEFNAVVEEKQLEEQRIKTAEYRKKQAEQNKQTVILEAQAESEKQRLLRNTTSKEVIDLKWIEKWDGKLPEYMMGGNGSFLMVNPKGNN